jgi:hypothetical protein
MFALCSLNSANENGRRNTMRRFISIAFLGLLVVAAPAVAGEQSPTSLLQGWYKQYLGREVEPSGLNYWIALLNDGASPAFVQSKILGSDEYFVRAGNDPSSFVQGLFRDVLKRKPTATEYRFWLARSKAIPYDALAYEFLMRFRK